MKEDKSYKIFEIIEEVYSIKPPALRNIAGISLFHKKLINLDLRRLHDSVNFSYHSFYRGRGIWINYVYKLKGTEKLNFLTIKAYDFFKSLRLRIRHNVLPPWQRLFLAYKAYLLLYTKDIAPFVHGILPLTGFLVREYVNGLNAFLFLKKFPEYKEEVAIKIIQSIREMHELGVFHGDLSLDNIILKIDRAGIKIRFVDFEWVWFNHLWYNWRERKFDQIELARMDIKKLLNKVHKEDIEFFQIMNRVLPIYYPIIHLD